MRVAISQPEHFPYLGFFQKMHQADFFVILDHVNYGGRNSFQNRNRFLNKQNRLEWFTVPIQSNSQGTPINQLNLSDDPNWRNKIVKKLKYNFNIDLTDVYSQRTLIDINLLGIKLIREKLKIETPMVLSSGLNSRSKKSILLYDICKELGASTYLCGPGGKTYLDLTVFKDITVEFLDLSVPDYNTSLSHLDFRF